MASWTLACPREAEVKMPIVRPKSSTPLAPRSPSSGIAPRDGRSSSGTHRIQREPPPPAQPGAFGEEEAPTGRLGGTQLRKLVARSADPELTARKNAFGAPTTPFAMPLPLAAFPPKAEAPTVSPAPVVIVNGASGAGDAPEIEVLGEVDEVAAFPLVAPSPSAPASAHPAPASAKRLRARRRVIALEPVDFAQNILGHGYFARRFLAFVLLVALVATAAWTATGGR